MKKDFEVFDYLGEEYVKYLVNLVKLKYGVNSITNENAWLLISENARIKNVIENSSQATNRKAKAYVVILLYGYIVILLGLFMFLKYTLDNTLVNKMTLSIIFIIFGLVICSLSFLLKSLEVFDYKNINSKLLLNYDMLYSLIIGITPNNNIKKELFTKQNLKSIKILSNDEIVDVLKLKNARNKISHAIYLDRKQAYQLLQRSNSIIKKIKLHYYWFLV